MKILKILSIFAISALIVTSTSCGDDDPKDEEVEDLESPTVAITEPEDGSTVSSLESTVTLTIEYEVTDDVEIASIVIEFDGTEVEEVTTFTDFREVNGEWEQPSVGDGEHTITITATDLSGKTATATSTFTKVTSIPYEPLEHEVFYMGFEGNYLESVSEVEATVVGSPDFAGEGKAGDDAYAGATDAYLTFDGESLDITDKLTVTMWLKINAVPDRAGILVMGPEDEVNTEFQNNRKSGFRFFREAAGTAQRFKVNFGTGDDGDDTTGDEVWLDGGTSADVDPTVDEWHHFAFVIDATTAAVYIDGVKAVGSAEHLGLDMTGCDILSIMSGVPRFTEWDHFSDLSYLDELHMFNAALTEAELAEIVGIGFGVQELEDPADPGLVPIDGADATEILYMSFDTDFTVEVADADATSVGTPSVVDGGVAGKAYSGGVDSYLTVPTDGLLGTEFSASMWIKMDPTATRAGILTVGAPDEVNPDNPNNRNFGFRLFREGDEIGQTFKLNVGTGAGEEWIDGGAFAKFSATREDWLHVAFTVGGGKTQVYLNGILAVVSGVDVVVDWTGCDILSIGSGAPRFVEWGHIGETGLLDEVRLYSGVLNPAQIAALKAVGD